MNVNDSAATRQRDLATLHEAADALLHLLDIKTAYPAVLTVMEPAEFDHLSQVLTSELTNATRRLPQDEAAFFLRGAARSDFSTDADELKHIMSAAALELMIGGDTRDVLNPRSLDELAEPLHNALWLATEEARSAKIRVNYLQYNWCLAPEAAASPTYADHRRHRQMLKLYWSLLNESVAVEAGQPITGGAENMRLTMAYIALRVVVHLLRLLPKQPKSDADAARSIQTLLKPFLIPTDGSPPKPFGADDVRAVREADAAVTAFVADARNDEFELTRTEDFCILKLRREIAERRHELDQHLAERRPSVGDADDIRRLRDRGESQEVEFKSASIETRSVVKEAVAMMNTRNGGVILVGVEDDGTVRGVAKPAEFDQRFQNALRATASPLAQVDLRCVDVDGQNVIALLISPWNKRDVYHYEHRIYVRKGTNAFVASPDEARQLYYGEFVS